MIFWNLLGFNECNYNSNACILLGNFDIHIILSMVSETYHGYTTCYIVHKHLLKHMDKGNICTRGSFNMSGGEGEEGEGSMAIFVGSVQFHSF